MLTAIGVLAVLVLCGGAACGLCRIARPKSALDVATGWAAWDGGMRAVGLILSALADLNKE